jgi:hypothetical protein
MLPQPPLVIPRRHGDRRAAGFDLYVTFRGKPLRIARDLRTLEEAIGEAEKLAAQRGLEWGPVEIHDVAADTMLSLETAARDARAPSKSGTMERVVIRGDATEEEEAAPTKRSRAR